MATIDALLRDVSRRLLDHAFDLNMLGAQDPDLIEELQAKREAIVSELDSTIARVQTQAAQPDEVPGYAQRKVS